MTDRYQKQELVRRLQYLKELLKEQDVDNPVAIRCGVNIVSAAIKYITEQ